MRTNDKKQSTTSRATKQTAVKAQQATVEQPIELYYFLVNEMLCAEQQILNALPKIVELTSDPELKTALTEHTKETEAQKDRLIEVMRLMGREEKQTGCKTMTSLLQEGQKQAERMQEGPLRDLAIIGGASKVEYFEMSAYRSLMTMADMLNLPAHIDLFEQTFKEEDEAAQSLSRAASQNRAFGMQGQAETGEASAESAMQSMPPMEANKEKEKESMRSNERERDSQGRFTSDDDDRGSRGRESNRGGGRDDGNDNRGWRGDPQGHSEAAREGWRNREGGGGRGRDDDDRDYNRGGGGGRGRGGEGNPGWRGDPQGHSEAAREGWRNREGGGGRGRDDDDRDYNRGGGRGGDDDRGWYGDPRGHSEAAREGWRNREGGGGGRGRDDDDRDYNRGGGGRGRGDDDGRGWYGDPRGHSEAAREGWRTREREGNDTYDEGNRPGWYGDSRGHSEAAREGWRDRDGGGGGRGRGDDDRDYNRGGGGGRGRGGDDDRGWYGDPRGHSEAAREGWRNREGGGGGGGRGRNDDDRGSNRGGGGGGRGRDDDDRGWYGDPQGHAEAARKGWQNRDR